MKITGLAAALILAAQHVNAASTGSDPAAQAGAANVGQQDKAFKMSPQDKTYGEKIDDIDKFSAPKKAPVGAPIADEEVKETKKGKGTDVEDTPRILDDYDPNRLGVSADEANKADKAAAAAAAGDKDALPPAAEDKDAPSLEKLPSVDDEVPDTGAHKAGLSTGTGEGTGGVGNTPNIHSPEVEGLVDHHKSPEPVDTKGDSASKSSTQSTTDPNTQIAIDSEEEFYSHFGRFLAAASMIILSELGDKTFFIAALMAMKHPHWFVFSSSFGALAVMTILSAGLGMVLPSLLSRQVTTFLASLLFLGFGIKLAKEGLETDPEVGTQDEMHEVEQEIELKEATNIQDNLEKGEAHATINPSSSPIEGIKNLASLVISPLWVQIFLMTFLAEWGDRSQIATVAMSAGNHFIQVVVGGLIGHAISTFLAIFGGKLLAKHLSLRTVTLSGAACFLLFAILYFYDWYTGAE